VGLVIPARNDCNAIIAYLAVLPGHRGNGYIDDILAARHPGCSLSSRPRIPSQDAEVLVTGMSGTGKSAALQLLGERGPPRRGHRHRPVESLDHLARRLGRLDMARGRHRQPAGQSPARPPLRRRLQDQPAKVLPAVRPYIALLSAPAGILLARITTRTSNPYGKHPVERALILQHLAEVEPRLRATATVEIDASAPLSEVVRQLEDLP
jgi:hypothetical protein